MLKRGYTLIEVLVVVVVIGIFAAVFIRACDTSKPEEAQRAAEDFARHIPDATGTTCTKTDTDGDGYCGCTVFVKNAPPVAIECGCEGWCIKCARGCKVVETVKFQERRR